MTDKTRVRVFAGAMIGGVAMIGLAAHFADAAESSRFSGTDKKAIEEIVHSYLVEHPEVLTEAMQALQDKQDAAAKAKTSTVIEKRPNDIFADGYSFVAGNPKAKVTVVEFFDYNCGHCRDAFPKLMGLIDTHADIRFVFKEFPIFQGSDEAAMAAMAAGKQGKYLEFHRALMSWPGAVNSHAIDAAAKKAGLDVARLRQDMKDPVFAARLEANHKLGEDLSIDGTPTFIVGKEVMSGWSSRQFDELVAKAGGKKT